MIILASVFYTKSSSGAKNNQARVARNMHLRTAIFKISFIIESLDLRGEDEMILRKVISEISSRLTGTAKISFKWIEHFRLIHINIAVRRFQNQP